MAIQVTVQANDDDALIAWRVDPWPPTCTGFSIEKRNVTTGDVTVLNNRIPAKAGGEVPAGGISSNLSPIRRCLWTDHSVDDTNEVQYRVTAITAAGPGPSSDWTKPLTITASDGDGLSAYFNRGTLMSQVVSRFLGEKPTIATLKKFKTELADPGFPARRYLSGQARHAVLSFLADADRRGNEIYAALYEVNDQELIEALKPFGARGHVLLGNGGAMKQELAQELEGSGLSVSSRDLSHRGASSPSVHNKFVVERDPKARRSLRVLTGSTNWTVTALCTQLNNVLLVERPNIAERFYAQWQALRAAGDDMPDTLLATNAKWTKDGVASVGFSATANAEDLAPALELVAGAQDGLFFLMFTPGQSPLLESLLKRSEGAKGPYVRGVVSEVRSSAKGDIEEHNGRVIRQGHESSVRDSTLVPAGVPADNAPGWALEEFTRKMFLPAGLMAIVHSKVIVVDPFSDNCAVITGSHNFSESASQKNDENVVIVRGNKALALAYAVHIQGVYNHYSWRAFLSQGGNPDDLFKSLDEWKPGGKRDRDVTFWVR